MDFSQQNVLASVLMGGGTFLVFQKTRSLRLMGVCLLILGGMLKP